MLSVIIPAHNESAVIGQCLDSILRQARADVLEDMEVIVATNGCRDDTPALCRAKADKFREVGIGYHVLELDQASKSDAIRAAEDVASFGNRTFLDADVVLGPCTLRKIMDALNSTLYPMVVCQLQVTDNSSWIGRAYAAALLETPYFKSAKAGAGFQTVSEAGRTRWEKMPQIISDDTFIRSHFTNDEIYVCSAYYHWPVSNSWKSLSRIRRRQEQGLVELQRIRPYSRQLRQSKAQAVMWLIRLGARKPLAALVYTVVLVRARALMGSKALEWYHDRSPP